VYLNTFAECEKAAAVFLGGQWHDARVELAVSVPSDVQWVGGGRWFRCDVLETNHAENATRRRDSLSGAAGPAGPVARRCFTIEGMRTYTVDGEEIEDYDGLHPIDCAQPHDAEFAGSFKVTTSTYPPEAAFDGIYPRCRDVVAGYAGNTGHGYLAHFADQREWDHGDRYVRCFAWHSEAKRTGSIKRAG
jgi:hypothetical protein